MTDDFEELEELEDDWNEPDNNQTTCIYPFPSKDKVLTFKEKEYFNKKISAEINQLEDYRNLAQSITENAKGNALLQGIETAFKEAARLHSPRKVLVFTESRRTQQYLKNLLDKTP